MSSSINNVFTATCSNIALSVHKVKTGDAVIVGISVRERSMAAETDEHPVGGEGLLF